MQTRVTRVYYERPDRPQDGWVSTAERADVAVRSPAPLQLTESYLVGARDRLDVRIPYQFEDGWISTAERALVPRRNPALVQLTNSYRSPRRRMVWPQGEPLDLDWINRIINPPPQPQWAPVASQSRTSEAMEFTLRWSKER